MRGVVLGASIFLVSLAVRQTVAETPRGEQAGTTSRDEAPSNRTTAIEPLGAGPTCAHVGQGLGIVPPFGQ